ncbi:MAG: hypothetical protein D6798_19130 [Deltaproteobacteria bacterium]|nr:MAG: hypothetical protein D6798_19130 [Deltaproteobacteria bacterium]
MRSIHDLRAEMKSDWSSARSASGAESGLVWHILVRVLTWVFIGGLYCGFAVVGVLQRQKAMRLWQVGCGSDYMFAELCVLVALFLGGFLIAEHARHPRVWSLVWWVAVVLSHYIFWSFCGESFLGDRVGRCGVL